MSLKIVGSRLAAPTQKLRYLPSEGGDNASHYQSPEHRAWRQAVLKRDGFACVVCGAKGQGVRLYADHIREIKDGGAPLDPDNGQTLCGAHHNRKTAEARAQRQ